MSSELGAALAIERGRKFVGRETDLRWAESWLIAAEPASTVLLVAGMGGVGKSALLLRLLDVTRTRAGRAVWLDGRVVADTPAEFLAALYAAVGDASPGGGAIASTEALCAAVAHQRTVVCVDNFEFLDRIGGWLRASFLPRLPAHGLLFVLAARQNLAGDWRREPGWHDRMREIRLEPLSARETADYCTRMGIADRETIRRVLSDTHGLPLALSLAVERLHRGESENGALALAPALLVSAELLREVAAPGLHEALEVLSILPHAVPEQLNRFLARPLNAVEFGLLGRLSFVRPTQGGLSLHDVARRYLGEDLRLRNPDRAERLTRQILGQLTADLRSAPPTGRRAVAAELVAISRDVFRIPMAAADLSRLQFEAFRPEDLPHLHAIVSEQAVYSLSKALDHALLDAIAEQAPTGIRVLRGGDGLPVAYNAGLLLRRETLALLDRFVPGVLERIFPDEAQALRSLPLEEATTYYQLLTGIASTADGCSWEDLEGALIVDMILHTSVGVRFLIVTAYADRNETLRQLGFRSEPLAGVAQDHLLHGAFVHLKDGRGSAMGEDLLGMLGAATLGPPHSAVPRQPPVEGDVKAALALLPNPAALGRSHLARKLGLAGTELQQRLRHLIYEAPMPPMDGPGQALLRMLCESPGQVAEITAQRLHMSRPTYYRLRKVAFRGLVELLGDL